MIYKKLMLIILDGWGMTLYNKRKNSAIELANTPFFDFCYNNYPSSILSASGTHVGLPMSQMGNSEVGHISLGSGRKILQSLQKINNCIKSKLFYKKINKILSKISYYGQKIHIIGLLSDGGVHSHINHLFNILEIFYKNNIKNIFIHAFMDGRDTYTKKGIYYIRKLLRKNNKYVGKLATVIGRFYAMDRDNRWERTIISYLSMVYSKGFYTNDIIQTISNFYDKGITDEFLPPIIVLHNDIPINIKNGDIVFCFNFRSDRSRQITELFIKKYKKFNGLKLSHYITMTNFNNEYKNVISIFDNEIINHTLGEVLEKEGKSQIRIAETEKYPHVTFFFSGGREHPFEKETRILCPSPKVSTYDLLPHMSAEKIVNKTISEIKYNKSDFFCVNFANPDMVGHTGNMQKTIKACEFVDFCLKLCVENAVKSNYTIIIVGDHGNAEYMIDENNIPHTYHTTAPVPLIIINNKINSKNIILKTHGTLSDIAPTILNLMNIKVPVEMTGKSMIIYGTN